MKQLGRIQTEISFNAGKSWTNIEITNLKYIEAFGSEIEVVSFDEFWERYKESNIFSRIYSDKTFFRKKKYIELDGWRYFKNDFENGEVYIRTSFDDYHSWSITEVAKQLNADDFCEWLQDKQINDLYVHKN